ncbi:MAG: helix-turn-helix domain-containing protein, partial [Pseudolabrys sp.]
MSEVFIGGSKVVPRRAIRTVAKRSQPRRGGRLTEERQREIVALVAPLFLERGYEQVSIDDIVERIGGSKRTLYERFGGKAGLFEIVISE